MNKYDTARRLKRMVREECKISEFDAKVARKCAKYYQQICNLETSLNKQELELSACRKRVNSLKRCNSKLEMHIQEEETRLCDIIQNIKQIQADCYQALQKQTEERTASSRTSDCIRSLKLSTQTYINLTALPHMIQGVTLCEKETSTDWKPFCIDPLKHTQKEVQDKIWHDTQFDSVYRETWKNLVLCDLLEEHNVDMETEIGTVTNII